MSERFSEIIPNAIVTGAVSRVNYPDRYNPGYRIVGYRVKDDFHKHMMEPIDMLEIAEQKLSEKKWIRWIFSHI